MVQDPLRLEPTPWDLLELPANLFETIRERLAREHGLADSDLTARTDREFRTALDRAFTGALKNRVPPQKAKVARDTLMRPTGRARIALLRIPPDAFARLSGERGAAALEPAGRAETARAWEAHFAHNLDDLPAAHGLLALWWSWVHWEEERLKKAPHYSPGEKSAIFDMWCALIGYVGLLAAERAFVAARFELSMEDAVLVQDDLVEALKAELLDRAQVLGGSVEGRRYRLLERFLVEEVHTARVLGAAHVTFGGVERAIGPRLLARLGLTETADESRKAQAARAPGPAAALALKVSLSPYAAVEALAREGKPDLALEALAILPPQEQGSPAVERARSAVLTVQALKLAGEGKLEAALAIWGRAAPGTLTPEAEADIVRLVSARVADLSRQRHERQALDLLVLAIKALPDSAALRSLVSTERYNKAIRSLEKIRERVQRGRMALTDMRSLSDLIDELESAVALGLEDLTAHLEWARVAVEAHSIGGQSNRQARAKLDLELGRWRDRSRRQQLKKALLDLVSEFRTAARLGSRLARGNAITVEGLLARLEARPADLPGLIRVELTRFVEVRGPGKPADEDIARLEDFLFDLEPLVVSGSTDASAVAEQIRPWLAALLAARAQSFLAAGLPEPLRGAAGVRLVTEARELKTLLAVREDLKRALVLNPAQDPLRALLADVQEALERAGRSGAIGLEPKVSLLDRLIRAPLIPLLLLLAVILLLFWLVKSVWKGVRTVHR